MANRSLHPLLHYLRRLSGGRAGDSALDDAQLLHRFASQRDESAFTTIVQRYGAMVWSLCVRRLGETPEAEDAFQATFLVLVRKAASLHGAQPLGPWLYGVAYRTALKLRGRRARQAAREAALPEQIAEDRPEPIWSDLRPILDEEIQRLPTKYRLPVLLCYLQGLSCEEAAGRLGCAKGTVFSRLSRAREILRPRLLRRGLDVSAGALAVVLAENAALRAMPSVALREITIRTSLLLAAGTASQTLSAPLAVLVEGVLRSMFLSKVKIAVIIVLAVGIVGSGAGFVAHRTLGNPPPSTVTPPAGSANKDKAAAPPVFARPPAPRIPQELLKQRVSAAQKTYTQILQRVKAGLALPQQLPEWSRRWLEAEKSLSNKNEDHLKALQAHLERVKEVENLCLVGAKRGMMHPADADAATYFRIEAEIWLLQAGGQVKPAPGKPAK